MKFLQANIRAPDGMPHPIWGYAVCLCPIKVMPGLNELTKKTSLILARNLHNFAPKLMAFQLSNSAFLSNAAATKINGFPAL